MPQSEKFPIGSRVTGEVTMLGPFVGDGTQQYEVPMRVLGYDGLKFVIVEVLQQSGSWKKGKVTLMPAKALTLREEVKFIPGEPEDKDGAAIGWMELGGLSVAITRAGDGAIQLSLERAPEYPEEFPVTVRISKMNGEDLWEGDIE